MLKRCEHKLSNGRRCVRKGEDRLCYQHLPLYYKKCNNDLDLSTNEFIDIVLDHKPIYRDSNNNCFSQDDLRGFLTKGSSKNPYTGEDLWKDREEFEKIISILDEEEKMTLREMYYPYQLSEKLSKALIRNVNLFTDIGMVGAILKSDFTDDFKASLSAIDYLRKRISESKDANIFLSLSIPTNRSITVKSVIENCSDSCIHGVGSQLINIYLYTRNHLFPKPPLAPAFSQSPVNTIILFPYISHNRHLAYYLFKNDPSSSDIIAGNYIFYDYDTNSFVDDNGHLNLSRKISEDILNAIRQSITEEEGIIQAMTVLASYISERDLVPLL